MGICPSTHYTSFINNELAKYIIGNNKIRNDYLLQFKNTSNASRSFIFHQLKIPVLIEGSSSYLGR